MKKCKVIPEEARFTQHRLLWAEIVIKRRKKRGEKQIKAWKQNDSIKKRMIEERVLSK